MSPGRSNKAVANSFLLVSFEENVKVTAKVKINGGPVVEKTLKELYEYIENEYSNMMIPNKQKFLTEHQKLIKDGYVLAGYHGTNEIAALSIMLNGIQPSTAFNPSDSHWQGIYVADNLKMSMGYALCKDYTNKNVHDHARILAVYAKKKDIKDIGITSDDIKNTFGTNKIGFKLNQQASGTIISGIDSSFDAYEHVIKNNIELKTTVLPIISQDDFDAVNNFFKLQEFAQKIITDVKSLPFIDHITNVDSQLLGLSQENKQTVNEILKLNKLVSKLNGLIKSQIPNTIIDRRNTIKEIKKIFMPEVSVLTDIDLDQIREHFYCENNLFIAVKDFKLIRDILKLKNLPDNALREGRALLKLPNLSNTAFQRIKMDLVRQGNLMASVEDFKDIRKFADKNNLRNPRLSDNEAAYLRNRNHAEIFKFTKDPLIDKFTEISKFAGKQDFANENAVKDLEKVLALKNLTKDDVKSVIGYFLVDENNVFRAVEDFKVIQDIIKLKHLPDNALVNARELLKLPNLSEIGYKRGVKEYLLAQHNLFDSVNILKVLRDNKENSSAVNSLKTLLSSRSINEDSINKIIESVSLEMKGTLSNNVQIHLEHPLINSELKIGGCGSGSATKIAYYPPVRQTRSIEALQKHKVTNLEDAQINQDTQSRDQVDPRNQLSYMKSSASTSYLQFWPVTIAKKATTALSSVLSIGWLYKMYSYEPIYPDCLIQSKELAESSFSILEMGDQGLNTADLNGLLNLALLFLRKFTGYTPKTSRVLSFEHEMNIKLDVQSTALVNEFIDAVLKHAESCGIASYISDIFEDSDCYFKTIQLVRQKLATGKLKDIPQLLYLQLVQNNNIKKKLHKSTQAHVNELLIVLANNLPNLQQKFLKYEENWLVDTEHPGRIRST